MSHTEGKLTLSKSGVIRAGEFHQYTNGKAQSQFAMVLCPDEWQAEEGVTQEENARRLVACWNACDGIPTKEMEGSGDILVWITDAGFKNTALEKERDELVKVLREERSAWEELKSFSEMRKMHDACDAILVRYPEGKS